MFRVEPRAALSCGRAGKDLAVILRMVNILRIVTVKVRVTSLSGFNVRSCTVNTRPEQL